MNISRITGDAITYSASPVDWAATNHSGSPDDASNWDHHHLYLSVLLPLLLGVVEFSDISGGCQSRLRQCPSKSVLQLEVMKVSVSAARHIALLSLISTPSGSAF